jgi:hypothetical protein
MKENDAENIREDFEAFLAEHGFETGLLLFGKSQGTIAGGVYEGTEPELLKLVYNAMAQELEKSGNSIWIAAALNVLINLMGVPKVVETAAPSSMN